MRTKILSVFLALVMVCSMIPAVSAAEPAASVVYIPLDDRPFNKDRMELLAAALNIDLIMPPEELYNTVLDGQPKNENGTQHGDRAALVEWLQARDGEYDTFILSLDQLLSGGLMNSRCMEENQDIVLSDGTVMTEYEIIDLITAMSEENEIYLIDSVMRLSSCSGYGGYNLDHYMALMLYGRVARPGLSGAKLTVDNIVKNYRSAASGGAAYTKAGLTQAQVELLLGPLDPTADVFGDYNQSALYLQRLEPEFTATVYAPVTYGTEEAEDSVLSKYLAARERKLRLSDYAMDALCGSENIRYLLGIDDSSGTDSIQTAEVALLERHLGENDQAFSSLDGLGQAALTHLYTDLTGGGTLDASVTYFGDYADTALSFNCDTPAEMISQAMAYFGCTEAEEAPDLSILVFTGSVRNEDREKTICDLVSRLNENEQAGLPTLLVDLTTGTDSGLADMLLNNTHLSMLLSYSGKTEIPNCVVMAMSQGIARYRSLQAGGLTHEAQLAHLENLSTALLSNFAFSDHTFPEMNRFFEASGLSGDNFYTEDSSLMERISKKLSDSMDAASEALFQNLSGGNFIVSLSPYSVQGVDAVSLTEVSYPWYRNMEICCGLEISLSEEAADTGDFHRAYVLGMKDHIFAPTDHLTREQAAKLILEAVGVSPETPETSFTDVSDWAKPYVAEAQSRGYINGYPDGTFQGEKTITRAEFVTIICNYAEKEGVALPATKKVSFSDVEKPESKDALWYAEAIYTLAGAGLINGYPNGTFKPDDQIRRVEAVIILNRLFDREEDVSGLTVPRFTDVSEQWMLTPLQEAAISHFSK